MNTSGSAVAFNWRHVALVVLSVCLLSGCSFMRSMADKTLTVSVGYQISTNAPQR